MPKETIRGAVSGDVEVSWGHVHNDTIQIKTSNPAVEDQHSVELGWAAHLTETQSSELIRTLIRAHRKQFLSVPD